MLFVLAITGLFTGAVVSEAREASMHLRSHQDAVAKVARIGSMGALGATIAHEINQPLAAIATYTDLVRREVGKDAPDVGLIAEAARKAGLQVDRAAGIIRQMRDLVRLGHHQAGRIDPALIFEESVELLQDVITQNKVRVSTRLPPDVPPVLADRIQIEQVVGNLMHNAIEAMRVLPAQQRNLRLIASAPVDGMLTMSVEDDGPGFAPQIRVDDVLSFISSKVDGLGIGLILSRTIVETHGGKLWIDRDGRGGIVRFTLRTAS